MALGEGVMCGFLFKVKSEDKGGEEKRERGDFILY